MTRSRKIAEQRHKEQHRSKSRTDHPVGKSQRPRPARRGAGDHPKPAQHRDRHGKVALAVESTPAGNDRLSDVAAVSLLVLGYVAMVAFFVGLAVGF